MNYSANYRAVVVDNADPKGLSRVRLKIPQILGDGTTGWAYPVGIGTVPNVGSPVWATFEGGDISFPVYMPSVASSAHTHPESDVTSLVSDIAALQSNVTSLTSSVNSLSTNKASLSGAAFTGNVSVTGTLTATSTVSASGLAGSLLSTSTPLINGTAATGVSAIPSRQDHVHPTDTTRAASTHSHAESDVTSLVADLALKAPLASPALTGSATAVNLAVSGTLTRGGVNVPSVTVSSTAPSSPTTGDIWLDTSDAWTSFTPTMTGWSQGAGTFDSYYVQIGKTVVWRCKFNVAGAQSGSPTLTLPVTAKAGGSYYFPHVVFLLSGGGARLATGWLPSTTTWAMSGDYLSAAPGYIGFNSITATAPGTWANGDHFNFVVTYEAA